jgi:nucleotide-binding universal stress UspA family protein
MAKTTAGRYRGRRPVLVGVDGSVSAQGALAWAAAEASYRHCPLQIVHAFTLPTMGDPVDLAVPPASTGNYAGARWILGEAESYARRAAPGVKVTAELFVAGAAPTLLSQAQNAEVVVVGSRGLGGFRGLLVGSVSATLAEHAPCPVIVVRPQPDGTAFPDYPIGRIVVGVDGSEVSTAAIRFALQEAARRRVGVTAVHATTSPRQHLSLRPSSGIVDELEERLFAQSLERLRVPGIDLETKVRHGHPAQVLIEESVGAALVVVGSYGGDGVTGMLLGSVSQAVLQHGHSPVAVVRPRRSGVTEPAPRAARQITLNRVSELKELS